MVRKVRWVTLDHQDRPVILDQLETPEDQEIQVTKVSLDNQVLKVELAMLVSQELQEQLVSKD
jgi:hypothetical protein